MTKLADMPDSQLKARHMHMSSVVVVWLVRQTEGAWNHACFVLSIGSPARPQLTAVAMMSTLTYCQPLAGLGAISSAQHCAQIQWELGSPLFGFLLRKYAPHDTYEVRCRQSEMGAEMGASLVCRADHTATNLLAGIALSSTLSCRCQCPRAHGLGQLTAASSLGALPRSEYTDGGATHLLMTKLPMCWCTKRDNCEASGVEEGRSPPR